MNISTVHEVFLHELEDAYSAENQLIAALPKMAEKAQDAELKANLEEHLEQTKGHVERLEKIFAALGQKASSHPCKAIQGIIAEGEEGLKEADPAVIDLMITASAARVEHYEQVLYTGLYEMASLMEHDDAADLIEETLEEEKEAGKKVEKAMKKALKEAPVGHEV